MTRDYKGTGSRSSGGKGSAFFSGLFIGVLLGLGIAVGVAWYIFRVPSPFLSKDKPADKANVTKPDTPRPTVPAPDKPRFEFYKILPGSEEPLSEQQLKEAAKKQQPGRDLYFLQAGAFQSASDADNLKAKLALLGVEASINSVTLQDKMVHRVRLGPYNRLEDMNQARELLKQNGIDATPIRAKEAAQ
jgi:cell division protein FtsN